PLFYAGELVRSNAMFEGASHQEDSVRPQVNSTVHTARSAV
ncbi:hypothetical protein BHECKSOX_316, partial [Bathymodiolus heckerae thiotrophic gill symbiont]